MAPIRVLQAGRAVAALAVVAFHAATAAQTFGGGLPGFLSVPLSYGYLGVDFFFVLSGFIIYHISREKSPDLAWLRSFSAGRVGRIYIPYLPVGIGMAILYAVFPTLSAGDRSWGWLETLTLAPTDTNPALIVAWTLQHEMLFYAVFAVGFLLKRPILTATVWALACLLIRKHLAFELINVEFLFGMVAAWSVSNLRLGWFPALSGASLAAFVVMGGASDFRVLFALSLAFAVAPMVKADARIPTPGWLMFLGAASYAIYLVHNPVLSVVARIDVPAWTILTGGFAIATLSGIGYHLLYERPASQALRGTRQAGSLRTPDPVA